MSSCIVSFCRDQRIRRRATDFFIFFYNYFEGFLECLEGGIISSGFIPKFAGDKQFFSVDAALLYGSSRAFLVAVNRSGIYMTVPRLIASATEFIATSPSDVCQVPKPTQGLSTPLEKHKNRSVYSSESLLKKYHTQ